MKSNDGQQNSTSSAQKKSVDRITGKMSANDEDERETKRIKLSKNEIVYNDSPKCCSCKKIFNSSATLMKLIKRMHNNGNTFDSLIKFNKNIKIPDKNIKEASWPTKTVNNDPTCASCRVVGHRNAQNKLCKNYKERRAISGRDVENYVYRLQVIKCCLRKLYVNERVYKLVVNDSI